MFAIGETSIVAKEARKENKRFYRESNSHSNSDAGTWLGKTALSSACLCFLSRENDRDTQTCNQLSIQTRISLCETQRLEQSIRERKCIAIVF